MLDPEPTPTETSDPVLLPASPMVSVLMTTYRHERYIAEAIESVVHQDAGFPFELLIGEDCSPDNTRRICEAYQEKYPSIIRLISWDRNVGARNNSIRISLAARGKYIGLCEGDDFWHDPDKLRKQVEILERDPSVGLVHSDYRHLKQQSGEIHECQHRELGRRTFERLTPEQLRHFVKEHGTMPVIRSCTVCMRGEPYRTLLKSDPDLYGPNRIFPMGDTQLFFELNLLCDSVFIPESLATYRSLEESASNFASARDRLTFYAAGQRLKSYLLEKHGLRTPPFRNRVRRQFRSDLLECLEEELPCSVLLAAYRGIASHLSLKQWGQILLLSTKLTRRHLCRRLSVTVRDHSLAGSADSRRA